MMNERHTLGEGWALVRGKRDFAHLWRERLSAKSIIAGMVISFGNREGMPLRETCPGGCGMK